ncbi:MAG: hypothetical protein K2R98_34280 [Gemmataceae bacterium]|nr:hypothetical protein [Gemmataceae bacterium]
MIVFITSLVLVLAVAAEPPQKSHPRPELLIEVEGIAKLQPSPVIIDARPRGGYDAGHIPGAVWVDLEAWSKAFADNPDKTEWTKRIGDLGIDTDTRVIVYDNGVKDAARI